MEKAISAADANRRFSQVLREVREGLSFVVTSHGKAVARIEPVDNRGIQGGHAKAGLIRRLRSERITKIGRWTREELYE